MEEDHIILSLEKQIVRLESRVAQLQMSFSDLVSGKLQQQSEDLEAQGSALRKLDARLEKSNAILKSIMRRYNLGAGVRNPRTYDDYKRVQEKLGKGMKVRQISLALDMPYTTCWHYANMSEAQAKRLPQTTSDALLGSENERRLNRMLGLDGGEDLPPGDGAEGEDDGGFEDDDLPLGVS